MEQVAQLAATHTPQPPFPLGNLLVAQVTTAPVVELHVKTPDYDVHNVHVPARG